MKTNIKINKIIAIVTSALVSVCFVCSCQNEKDNAEYSIETNSEKYVLVKDTEGYTAVNFSAEVYKDGEKTNKTPKYEIKNSEVAKIENGKIVAVEKGVTQLSVTYKNAVQDVNVEVLEKLDNIDVFNTDEINLYGRNFNKDGSLAFYNTASGFEVNFIGTSLSMKMVDSGSGSLKVFVDGEEKNTLTPTGKVNYSLVHDLEEGFHTVKVLKMTEQGYLKTALTSLSTDGSFVSPLKKPDLKFEFYGDSITCGFGNLGANSGYHMDEDGTNTYATMVADYFGAEASIISHSGVSACLKTSNMSFTMQEMYDKIYAYINDEFDFSTYVADVVVINLGTNDSNGGGFDGDMYTGYKALVEKIHAKQPKAKIVCIYGMMGIDRYIDREISKAVEELAEIGYKITYSAVPANRHGVLDHPDVEGHITASEAVIDLINSFNRF